MAVLTGKQYDDARKYWKVLKGRLKNEGSELVSFCYQLKMVASDGKLRDTDVLDTKGVLRLVQSVPNKKAVKLTLLRFLYSFYAFSELYNFDWLRVIVVGDFVFLVAKQV